MAWLRNRSVFGQNRTPALLGTAADNQTDSISVAADPTSGALYSYQATKLDIVNDAVVAATFGHTYTELAAAATTTIKSGAGVLHGILITNPGATANTVKIYDNTAGSGTVIADWSTSGGAPVAGFYPLDVGFTTGLTVVIAGTTSPVITVVSR